MATANQLQHVEENSIDLSGGLLGVIARAARDPSVDIDKMERLLELQERVLRRQAHASYHAAMAEMQPKLPVISERGKILNKQKEVQSTYALWEDINDVLKPLLAEHGFSLTFKGRKDGNDHVTIGILTHKDGHSEHTEVSLPRDESGSKNVVQAIGSAKAYGKRYAAFDLLNITTRGADDDGESASQYLASGEPKARAVLDGLHTSKTALRTAVHAVIAAVRAAKSQEEIDTIIRESKETRKQAERDWPALINGDPKIPEDIGLRGAVEQQRAMLDEDGQFAMLIKSMKQCETLLSLTNWMAANEAIIEELDGAESRKFQLAYELHESGIREMDKVTS